MTLAAVDPLLYEYEVPADLSNEKGTVFSMGSLTSSGSDATICEVTYTAQVTVVAGTIVVSMGITNTDQLKYKKLEPGEATVIVTA